MKLHEPFTILSTLLLVTAWLVSGCSGSSESIARDEQYPIESTASEPNNSNDDGVSNANNNTIESESDTEIASAEMILGGDENEAVISNQAVVDPLIQNTIPVTFEITVPYYLSNELRVELIWGEVNLTAMWVGGQFWSATSEFPTQTEYLLSITLIDKNGVVELARYSNVYKTGSNATESFQVLAEQFDASQFDSDGDGINNLVELNAGKDPFLDQDSLLEIVEAVALSNASSQHSRIVLLG